MGTPRVWAQKQFHLTRKTKNFVTKRLPIRHDNVIDKKTNALI